MLRSLTLSLMLWLVALPAFAEDCTKNGGDGTVAGCTELMQKDSNDADIKKETEADLKQLDTGTSASTAPQPSAAPESESAMTPFPLAAGVYRLSGTNPDGSEYFGLVALTEEDDKVKITCWDGKKVMRGTGNHAGDSFVLKWNDGIRVTFRAGDHGTLEGGTADGGLSETLEPFAIAAPNDVTLAEGTYAVSGRIANGDTYDGTAKITKAGKGYHVSWKTDPTSYEGSGTLVDNLLTVTWGSTTPAVYALAADGSLLGLWDRGFGEEILVPESPNLIGQPSAKLPRGSDPDRGDCNKRIAMDVALAAASAP